MKTRFGLIRHAMTVWNEQRRIQGQQDSPVSHTGEDQIDLWSKRLFQYNWDLVLSSDLGRARHTADGINRMHGLPVFRDRRLREQDWGGWTGKTLSQLKQEVPGFHDIQKKQGWAFQPPGGESRLDVWKRSQTAILDGARKWPGKNILVVSHEGVIKVLLYRWMEKNRETEWHWVRPYHLHRLVCMGGIFMIEMVNAVDLNGEQENSE
jgi:probable phosphoglycerate mutase